MTSQSLRKEFLSLCKELMINLPKEGLEPTTTSEPEPVSKVTPIKMEPEVDLQDVVTTHYVDPMTGLIEEDEIDNEEECVDEISEEKCEVDSDSGPSFVFDQEPPKKKMKSLDTWRMDNRGKIHRIGSSYTSHTRAVEILIPSCQPQLQDALDDIAQGMMPIEASRKHGVPKSTLYRWAKKIKVND